MSAKKKPEAETKAASVVVEPKAPAKAATANAVIEAPAIKSVVAEEAPVVAPSAAPEPEAPQKADGIGAGSKTSVNGTSYQTNIVYERSEGDCFGEVIRYSGVFVARYTWTEGGQKFTESEEFVDMADAPGHSAAQAWLDSKF